jgi:hypothetical protein
MSCISEKIPVGGIKLSNALVHVIFLNGSFSENSRPLFVQTLANHNVNIPFLSLSFVRNNIRGSCCVAAEDINQVKKLIAQHPELERDVEFIADVGALSIFPHRSTLKLLGSILYAFGNARLPIYGMASSISALTFITGYSCLDKAVETLLTFLELPERHTPLKPEIRIIQQKR